MLLQDVMIIDDPDRQAGETLDGQLKEHIAALNEEVYQLDVTEGERMEDESFLLEWNMTSGLLSLVLW